MGRQRILVTDLDGTLLGDDAACAAFAEWLARHRPDYRLVYASGRMPAAVHELIGREGLPVPDAVISAVGTEIHDAAGRPWPGWDEHLGEAPGPAVREALRALPWLTPQPAAFQSARKSSYDVPGLASGGRTAVRRALAAAGIRATLVFSAGRHLDVIPRRAGKGRAARVLARSWGVPGTDVLAFGDSGNDAQLLSSGFRGTIVANAAPELRHTVRGDVYRSPYPHAWGILDGIRHWVGPAAMVPRPATMPA